MIRSSYAWFSLLKAMCGVGVFALPVAYKQSGLWVGTALTVLLGIANAHCMLKLVKCSQYLCKLIEDKGNEKSSPDSKKGQPDAETSKAEKSSTSKREKSRKDPKKGKEDRKLLTTVNVECEKEQLKAGSTMKSVEGLANDSNASKESAKHEGERGVTLDYGAMASEAFAIKDSWLRHLAGSFKMAVNLCLVLLQLGICSVFYIFVADHVKEVLDNLYSTNLSINVIFFALLPFFLALVSVQNLNVMSLIAFIGNLMILAALFIIDTGMVFREHIPFSQLSMVTTVGSAASAAGSITYAFAAQALVLPLENKMREPQRMLGLFGVISTAVALVCVLYAATGFLGYITYGDTLKGSITLNLTNAPLDLSVKIMLLLMTFCGYLIQHFPIIDMIWPPCRQHLRKRHPFIRFITHYSLRYGIVILTFVLAWAVPNLEEIIPMIGVTTGMLLAFVFPAVLDITVFWSEWKEDSILLLLFNVILDLIYVVLGLFFLVLGLMK